MELTLCSIKIYLQIKGCVARPIACGVGVASIAGAMGPTTDYSATATQKCVSSPSNVLSYVMNRQTSSKFKKARRCFIVNRIYNAAGNVPVLADSTVYVGVTITEPLLLSPFIFGSPESNA